jgi:Holliday junction resolvase RusA-like endonuclease
MELELPYPPSVNHLWRRFRNRTVLSREGRDYRRDVRLALAAGRVTPLLGPLAVSIDVNPPDRRRRDLDNLHKALLDALGRGGAYFDDSQIDRLTITRCGIVRGGRVRVQVKPFEPPPEPPSAVASPAKPRNCLKCGKMFDSLGPGNRICPRCQQANARVAISERELQAQRGQKRQNGEILVPALQGAG